MEKIKVQVSSEIGELEAVIVHTPGKEVENMTPENAEKSLYSDILNLSVAKKEYSLFKGALQKHTQVFEMTDLLNETLKQEKIKEDFVKKIFAKENLVYEDMDRVLQLPTDKLLKAVIEGVVMKKNNLTRFFSGERYSMHPLPNFFFMRDASMSINNNVLIGKMASNVRDRETIIMDTIFTHHPLLETTTINPANHTLPNNFSIEGGDVLIAREDVLLIGTGLRTTSQGIDFIIEQIKKENKIKHIIVQELPHSPESFIHLDMVFTFLDTNKCMVFEPLILNNPKYRTVYIAIGEKNVKINLQENIISALKKLNFDLEPIYCGGATDSWTQQREQWHSGANFVALAPGKVVGYERNSHTIEEMNKNGFEILSAQDIVEGKVNINDYKKYVVAIKGSELSRGGGGARCMSMPIRRKNVQW